MVASPDLLLNTKAPAAVAKPASSSSRDSSQASRNDASSFADVYAKERQSKPVERRDSAATGTGNESDKDRAASETAEKSGTLAPAPSEAGNDLPLEENVAGAEVELDPLLLMGMGAQSEAADSLPVSGSELLAGLPQGQVTLAEADVALEAEEPLLAQRALLDTQASAQKAQMLPAQALAEGEELAQGKAHLASLLPSEMAGDDGETFSLEEDFVELLDQPVSPKEGRSSAVDAVPDRLNALTQAITQQNLQAQRPALVPGQPLNLQQANLSEAVVDRVMWLSSQNLKSAEIQLDPAELGRMEIRIDMSKEHSQVTFLSPHAGVRDTLEGQMQRLRDMFAQQGMSMDVNVSDQSTQGRQGEKDAESSDGRGALAGVTGNDDEVHQGALEISGGRAGEARGLVDFYA